MKFINKENYLFSSSEFNYNCHLSGGHRVQIFLIFLEVGKYIPEIYSLTELPETSVFPEKFSNLIQCEPQGHSVQHSAALRIKNLYIVSHTSVSSTYPCQMSVGPCVGPWVILSDFHSVNDSGRPM